MFLCNECTPRQTLAQSYGPCEICKKVGVCNDVNMHYEKED